MRIFPGKDETILHWMGRCARFAMRRALVPAVRRRIRPTTTIICNNCLGARISQDCGYRYNSPTVGLYFRYPDYITFLEHLDEAVTAPLRFKEAGAEDFPVGILTAGDRDIEIYFMHYRSEEEAREKWEERRKRVNTADMLVIGSEVDGCTHEDVERFCLLPYERKLFITRRDYSREIPSRQLLYRKTLNSKRYTNLYDLAHICYPRLCRI